MQCWQREQILFTASVLSCVIPACAWMQTSHVWPSLAQPASRALRVHGFVAFPTRHSPPAARQRASRSLTMSDRPAVHVSCASVRDRELLLASAASEDLALLNIEGGAAGVSVCDKAVDAVLKPTPEAAFDASRFHSFLALRPTRSLGRVLVHAETLSSTQELLFDQCRSPPDGLLCIADRQTKGKGRGSNEWASPAGCLCFSFVWSVADAALLPFFQYIVSMALYRAVAQEAGDAKRLGLRLKWPNDIYIVKTDSSLTVMSTKTKIGGVLCQSTVAAGAVTGKPFRVVAGVGVNVLNSQPTTCLRDVVAQHDDD